ncbi:MAG: hypothetical protein ACTSYM_00430 [Candidatus Baldrarchaeia archaeon]
MGKALERTLKYLKSILDFSGVNVEDVDDEKVLKYFVQELKREKLKRVS